MKKPLVSIVCTIYNKRDWISEAIESFLAQKTKFDIEILLIDDKSTDGSDRIIKEYANKFPKKIRAFYNEENLGITKTWIKICQEVRGKYIARCDGDDYWIDDLKLQKQVELLESSKDSKWCNSDFRTINEFGEVLSEKSFESGFIKMSHDFTEVLVEKGFTNASTWLVDSRLMRKVCNEIDQEAADDTFNIQLELFARTKLSFLPDATTVYRINQGSDSHPNDMEKVNTRNSKLHKTQVEYINRYNRKIDRDKALLYLIELNSKMEVNIIDLNKAVKDRDMTISSQHDFIEEQSKVIDFQQGVIESKMHRIATNIQNLLRKIRG